MRQAPLEVDKLAAKLAAGKRAHSRISGPPLAPGPERALDFWIGRWRTRWVTPEGNVRSGGNVVLELGGHVCEFFEGPSANGRYVGVSLSTWEHSVGAWNQEYWDNSGYHAFFSGGMHEDVLGKRFILDLVRGGGITAGARRLVWHTIKPNSLLWDYELSDDEGASWTSTWRIKYIRIPAPSAPVQP